MKIIVLCLICTCIAFQQPARATAPSTYQKDYLFAPPQSTDADTVGTSAHLDSTRRLLITAPQTYPGLIPEKLAVWWMTWVLSAEFVLIPEPTIKEGYLDTYTLVRKPLALRGAMGAYTDVTIVVGQVTYNPHEESGVVQCSPRFEVYLTIPATQGTPASYVRIDLLYSNARVERLVDDVWGPLSQSESAKVLSLIELVKRPAQRKGTK